MRSIKRGRGPSLMGGVGGLMVAVFGVFWTGMAVSIGAPWFFVVFGAIFVGLALFGGIGSLYNATARNRFSEYDITDHGEETDPIAHVLGHDDSSSARPRRSGPERDPATSRGAAPRRFEGGFCPYCGAAVQDDFAFCPACGKDI